jgi:hypothetical protein
MNRIAFTFTENGALGIKFAANGKITRVGGQARELGFNIGDVIVEVDGVKVNDTTRLARLKKMRRPGTIKVIRTEDTLSADDVMPRQTMVEHSSVDSMLPQDIVQRVGSRFTQDQEVGLPCHEGSMLTKKEQILQKLEERKLQRLEMEARRPKPTIEKSRPAVNSATIAQRREGSTQKFSLDLADFDLADLDLEEQIFTSSSPSMRDFASPKPHTTCMQGKLMWRSVGKFALPKKFKPSKAFLEGLEMTMQRSDVTATHPRAKSMLRVVALMDWDGKDVWKGITLRSYKFGIKLRVSEQQRCERMIEVVLESANDKKLWMGTIRGNLRLARLNSTSDDSSELDSDSGEEGGGHLERNGDDQVAMAKAMAKAKTNRKVRRAAEKEAAEAEAMEWSSFLARNSIVGEAGSSCSDEEEKELTGEQFLSCTSKPLLSHSQQEAEAEAAWVRAKEAEAEKEAQEEERKFLQDRGVLKKKQTKKKKKKKQKKKKLHSIIWHDGAVRHKRFTSEEEALSFYDNIDNMWAKRVMSGDTELKRHINDEVAVGNDKTWPSEWTPEDLKRHAIIWHDGAVRQQRFTTEEEALSFYDSIDNMWAKRLMSRDKELKRHINDEVAVGNDKTWPSEWEPVWNGV